MFKYNIKYFQHFGAIVTMTNKLQSIYSTNDHHTVFRNVIAVQNLT